MLLFLFGRDAEGRVLNSRRIHVTDHVSDHATLACGVHSLQDQQDGTAVPGPAVGVEQLLQVGQDRAALLE